MKSIPINIETLPEIKQALVLAIASKKNYQVSISIHDNSLRGRQRALANIWYKQIEEALGEPVGYAEALCKYSFGLKLRCDNDPDLSRIVRRMLDGFEYEAKLEIIRVYPEWFPVLRDKGGLNAEDQARYLNCIQVHFANQGVILTSPREKDLLNCAAANY